MTEDPFILIAFGVQDNINYRATASEIQSQFGQQIVYISGWIRSIGHRQINEKSQCNGSNEFTIYSCALDQINKRVNDEYVNSRVGEQWKFNSPDSWIAPL